VRPQPELYNPVTRAEGVPPGQAAQPKTLLFLHIPKAGGTTLQSILAREYAPEISYAIGSTSRDTIAAFCALPQEQRHKVRMLCGHMGFGLHRYCAPPTSYMTFLRQPVPRVISTYDYILRTPSHTHYARLTAGPLSLAEFVRQGVSKVGVDNGQTRLLSGEPNSGDGIGFRECTRTHLEQAKANLAASFAAVGLMERYNASLLIMQRAFGWRTPYYVEQNVSQGRAERAHLPKDVLRMIADYNQLDSELYRFAQGLFEQQVKRQGPLFAARVWLFGWLNRRRSQRARARAAA
jgi:hypothetical protein